MRSLLKERLRDVDSQCATTVKNARRWISAWRNAEPLLGKEPMIPTFARFAAQRRDHAYNNPCAFHRYRSICQQAV